MVLHWLCGAALSAIGGGVTLVRRDVPEGVVSTEGNEYVRSHTLGAQAQATPC